MSRLNVGNLFNENEDGSPVVSGISTFSSPHYFIPPSGSTAQRPQNPGEGMIRFNTDSGHLEYYTGELWVDVIVNNQELGGGTGSNTGTGHRGIFANGQVAPSTGTYTNHIEYLTISSTGNGETFGDTTATRSHTSSMASRTRCVFGSGYGPSNVIDFITIASTGDATDFGDNATAADSTAAAANQIRGLMAGGSSTNIISYITIAQTGNAVDFGDLTRAHNNMAGASSSVRGVFAGGGGTGDIEYNTIDYVTISTTGNASDFGDLTYTVTSNCAGGSNSTRMIIAGGADTPGYTAVNTINFLTIATTGDAQDFGDLTTTAHAGAIMSDSVRAVIKLGGTASNSSTTNTIDFVTIATTGNASDFGDSVNQTYGVGEGTSNGHGGL